uniref:uncharacterized protein LOC120335528 n=1 Tax=Styela clava TaxID=7725 RepID=UPI00193AD65E|nr:uncharacterized protein LOC120335528 [Styela clava]
MTGLNSSESYRFMRHNRKVLIKATPHRVRPSTATNQEKKEEEDELRRSRLNNAYTPTSEETTAPTTRPRTLFLTTTKDLDFPRLFDILKTDSASRNYVNNITGLFEGRKGQWICTFAATDDPNSSCREQFLHDTKGEIRVSDGAITVSLPTEAPVRISIRGIPGETSYSKAVSTIERLQCGKVRNATRNWYRGTSIYNGYTSFFIENFKKDRLPDYLVIDGKSCKTYLPRESYVPTCGRCLKSGHNFTECKSEPVCRYCKQLGHLLKECPSRRKEFPSISGSTWTFPRRRKQQSENPPFSEQPSNQNASQPATVSDLQNASQPGLISDLQNNQNAVQPTKPDIPNDQMDLQPESTTLTPHDNRIDPTSNVIEFSSSTESTDLKEISNWSECEDVGSVIIISPLSTPPSQPQLKQTRQSSRLKQSSTIGNTPFHPTSKGNPYVKVMVHNIQPPDLTTSSVFSTAPGEISSAPANLEYNKSKSKTVDLPATNLDNSDYAIKRSREETSSDSSFSTTLEFRLVGKKKK